MTKLSQAEKDAAAGTIDAMWAGYLANVLRPLHIETGESLTEHGLKSRRLDFLSGIKATTTLLRVAKERRGVPLEIMLGLLEVEVLERLGRKP